MNTTMADGAAQRLVAQIGEALFGQPGLTLMELAEKVKQHDLSLDQTIGERDRYHEVADELAGHIAAITGVDIGEHSSANCPWQNAIEAAEEYQSAQPSPAGQNALPPIREDQPLRGDEPIGEQHDARLFNRGWNACREAAAALATRQPVGEPVCPDCTTPLLYECPGCSKMNYPEPAQAVDLGQFRDLAERLLQEGEDAGDAHTNADYRYCARELLALIASKAVGK